MLETLQKGGLGCGTVVALCWRWKYCHEGRYELVPLETLLGLQVWNGDGMVGHGDGSNLASDWTYQLLPRNGRLLMQNDVLAHLAWHEWCKR